MMDLPPPTWFVGCGNMAGAMIDGWKAARVDMSGAIAIRPSGTPVPGMRTVTSVAKAGEAPRIVILGFKPQQLDEVAAELAAKVTPTTIIISMLAGVETASLRSRFGEGAIVRISPNLPVSIRRGVVALHSNDIEEALRRELGELFSALGYAMWTNSETMLAAIGAVSGAGPAYAARFIAALASAGERLGLPPQMAATIARETVLGTAWMAASAEETMAEIARRVASPNGTTEAGLAVLDANGSLDRLVGETIEAAAARGRSLAEAARLS